MRIQAVMFAIFAFACSWTFYARGDCSVSQVVQVNGNDINDNSIPDPVYLTAQPECGVTAATEFPLVGTDAEGNTYSEVDHKVIEEPPGSTVVTNVIIYDTFHVAGTVVQSENLWESGDRYPDSLVSSARAGATEDVWIGWDSTDAPPTSITFQGIYLLQGQVNTDYDPEGHFEAEFDVNENANVVHFPEEGLYTPAISVPFSTNVLGGPITCPVNALTSIGVTFAVMVEWWDPCFILTNLNPHASSSGYYGSYTSPSSYTASFYFEGYTDIVDESNQPVDPGKLTFRYVNPMDPTNISYAMPGPPSAPDLPVLQVLTQPAASGLTLQWPLYASNYQLQMTTNFASGIWTADSLPAPLQVGSFLEVTVPVTNSCAFFRLVQMQ